MRSSTAIRSQVMQAIDAYPHLPDHLLARRVSEEAGDAALLAFATEQVEKFIKGERRKRIRNVEVASTTSYGNSNGLPPQSAVAALLEEYRREVIVEWTTELLSAEFALGDGQRVTWGEATVDQHAMRIGLLTQNVRGNLDAIERHEAAIKAISDGGVSRLAEIGASR